MPQYGIRGIANNRFKSYLENRKLRVKCITTSSSTTCILKDFPITYGTAQGSILGPLLFLIFCNNIYLNITYSKLILFAHDTTIYCSHENDNYLHQIIEQDITSIMDCINANKLSLNLLKTVSVSFHNNNKKIKFNFKIDGILIPQVKNFKFLGLTIDNKLEWNQHFTLLFNKLLINQQMLSLNKKLLNTHTKNYLLCTHL